MAQALTLQSDGSDMKLFEVRPEGQPRGAVIVIQEAFGMTDHIKDIVRRFAAEGFLAVAPHMFHRTGDPVIPYDKMQMVMPHMMKIDAVAIESDIAACLDYLRTQGFSGRQVGIIGFCMGGTMAFWAGVKWPLGAAVSCYGGGIVQGRFGLEPLNDMATALQTPWQGHYGDRDQSIPLTEVEVLRRTATKAQVPTEVFRYPDADHGFHCNDRSQFHAESAAQAWDRIVAFMKANVGAK